MELLRNTQYFLGELGSFLIWLITMVWPSIASYWAGKLLNSERKKWVMFQNGSVVIFIDRPDSENNSLEMDAIEIMKRDGPVYVGTEHGDFQTISLDDGYIVTSHNPNLMIVHEGIIEGGDNLMVGLMLRSRRDQDSSELKVIANSLTNNSI